MFRSWKGLGGWPLLALTLLAAAVRSVGLEHGLPHSIEPDTNVSRQVEYLRGERKGKRAAADMATYPHLLARATVALFDAPPHPGEVPQQDLAGHLELASRHFLDVRRVTALLSLLIVPGTFLVARRFVGAGWALTAAALAGFSLLGVDFAQQARPHASGAGFTALAIAAALRLRVRGDLGSWCLAGLAAALAIGNLQSGIAVLCPIAVAHLVGERRRLLDPRALVLPLFLAVAAICFYPFLLDSGESVAAEPRREGETLWIANHNLELDRFNGAGFARVLRTLWWYEPVLLALLVLSSFVFAWDRFGRARESGGDERAARGDVLVVLGYALPYLLVIGIYQETFERFVLPLIPVLATFSVWGLARLGSRRVALVLGGAALLGTLAPSARLAWLRSRPDTLAEAAAWVSARIDPGELVSLSPIPNPVHGDASLELPLLRSEAALASPGGPRLTYYNIWSRYQDRLAPGVLDAGGDPRHDLRWLVWSRKQAGVPAGVDAMEFLAQHPRSFFEASGPGWFVIEDHRGRPENATEILLQDALAELGTRVARFSPDPPASDRGFPFTYQDRDEEGGDWPHVAWRVLTARTTGPAVEVWRVDQAGLDGGPGR